MTYRTLRFILGDQLNAKHSWFRKKDSDVLYVIAELNSETSYINHHIQKVAAFFLAMENFAAALKHAGHDVLHLTLDDTNDFSDTKHLIESLINKYNISSFEYQRPDEFRLSNILESIECNSTACVDSEHFILPFDNIPKHFKKKKAHRMEAFYRKMRKYTDTLIDEKDEPIGGQWNFDKENRKSFKTEDILNIPPPKQFRNNISHILKRLKRHNVKTIGKLDSDVLTWPSNRKQARQQLQYFCTHLLEHFGDFQDAMTGNSPHQVFLYHSGLSFSLNTKMLSPTEVVQAVISELHSDLGNLPQIEGFVRQVIGWREFVRGIYWSNMPNYKEQNFFDHQNPLPKYFWDGNTQLNCLKHALDHSLKHAYAHHIERLMVIGNFCLLSGIDPDQVDAWYLGVYVDAIEWIQLPNTRGMSQFADGGLLASKPYISSGQYINKMSDYCKGCRYNVSDKIGPKACPFNSLYWSFLDRNSDRLKANPRLKLAYNNWSKQSSDNRAAILKQADHYLNNIETL